MLKQLRARRQIRQSMIAVHQALIAQARQPYFYSQCGVPDTLDGRFEMIILHAFLVFHRLNGQGPEAEHFSQALFDHLFLDLDSGLRELGVGDLAVGKRIKEMARAFYGRAVAYEKALVATDSAALREALDYNLYGTREPSLEHLNRMAAYLKTSAARLQAQDIAAIMAGTLDFAPLDMILAKDRTDD